MKNILMILTTILLTFSIHAQDFWERTNGPYGGHINTFAVDSSGRIFTGTAGGGVFRTSNNGENWTPINIGLNTTEVYCLVTNTSEHIFAATLDNGIFRSTNIGDSWTQINAGLSESRVYSIAMDPSENIFAGTKSGIFRSTDNGENWVLTGGMNYIVALAINDSGHIFAGTYGTIYRSTNNGATWTDLEVYAPVIPLLAINSIGYVFAGTFGAGFLRSTDNGENWEDVSPSGAEEFAFTFNQSGYIFAGGLNGIHRSTNNGDTWTMVSSGMTGWPIYAMTIDQSQNVFAGTADEGVFRSTTNGENWTQNNNGLAATDIISLAINSEGEVYSGVGGVVGWQNMGNGNVFSSTNDGDDWISKGKPANWHGSSIPALAINSSGNIFAGTEDYSMENWSGIVRSTDSGGTWVGVWFSGDSYPVFSILINPDGYIYAGTGWSSGEIMKSTDNGNNWAQLNTASGAEFVYDIVANSSGHLFAAMDVGIYRSTDDGISWMQINSGLTVTDIRCLLVHPSGNILAGTYGGGVFRSSNNGEAWEAAGLTSDTVRAFVINSIGDIYAGTEGSGVYYSTDIGNTWNQFSTGLASQYVYSLAINPNDRLFAGTLQGVFRSVESTVNVEQVNEHPSSIELAQNYPNPFNPSTTIRYSIPTSEFVILKVYDVLGNEIATLVNEEKPAGSYEVEFSAKSGSASSGNAYNLSSGIYFYKIQAGNFVEIKKMILMK